MRHVPLAHGDTAACDVWYYERGRGLLGRCTRPTLEAAQQVWGRGASDRRACSSTEENLNAMLSEIIAVHYTTHYIIYQYGCPVCLYQQKEWVYILTSDAVLYTEN